MANAQTEWVGLVHKFLAALRAKGCVDNDIRGICMGMAVAGLKDGGFTLNQAHAALDAVWQIKGGP